MIGPSSALARHLLAWFLLAAVAVLNGVTRQGSYGKVLPELAAHQVSTLTGMIATGFVGWVLSRRWPLDSARQAWLVGCGWLTLTVLFEFGFGHYVAGHTWQRLLQDYDLLQGRVWSMFLIWLLLMPYLFHRLARPAA
ncbi:MAG TPA: hypothetical protein VLB07_10855 [Woeseiaceae bacterium]|nr:hypothetical protein [Woeseiaceae bacterium]